MSKRLTLDQVMELHADALRATKESLCRVAGGPHDLVAQMTVVTALGEHRNVLLPGREAIPELARAVAGEFKPSIVLTAADEYVRQLDPGDEWDAENARGRLRAEREAGDMRVGDALSVMAIEAKTGRLRQIIQHYTYDDAGQPVFGEVAVMEHGENGVRLEGAIADLLRVAVA